MAMLRPISQPVYEPIIELLSNLFLLYNFDSKHTLDYKFVHATAAWLSWHVQIYDLIRLLFFTSEYTNYYKIWSINIPRLKRERIAHCGPGAFIET